MRVYFPGLRVLAFDNCEFWWGGVVEGGGHFFASPLYRPGVDKSGDRSCIERSAGFDGRASRREGPGQPPKLARTYLSHTSSGCVP